MAQDLKDKWASTFDAYHQTGVAKTLKNVDSTTSTVVTEATNAVVLSLSAAWLGISLVKPASTGGGGWGDVVSVPDWAQRKQKGLKGEEYSTPTIDRYDTRRLWSLQIGDYFMPLSQTYTLRARKKLNVSSLVDGIDIIQQTRKEAKTIDCSLRLTLRDNQPNLEIVRDDTLARARFGVKSETDATNTEAYKAMRIFGDFLQEFYEADAIFKINNSTINETFGVDYVFISEYTFKPRAGAGTFQFDFSLTEVILGDDVLTFDVREIGDA